MGILKLLFLASAFPTVVFGIHLELEIGLQILWRKMYRARAEGLTFTKEPYIEDVGPRRIKSMQFTALSESEISKIAEVQVAKGSYYDSSRQPFENGLLDPRMGPANKSCTCATCHGKFADCPGHYGYLNLALPVFNVGYKEKILQILKCICK
ncbi:DNA-directed RNA polymerase III subunit 1-like, partial [Neltuma alba]|uniref:DNA-directed RNA polymerase III subunit 1-like n=1 Tax=Neltuma alba TaxID=207710 RepID=UPI0010A399B6